MTLSLDDVRNKRFRMARRSGYEVLEVDEFVDEVEVSFERLAEENQNLKKQIEALKAAPSPEAKAAGVVAGTAQPETLAVAAQQETIVVTTAAEASSAVVRLVAMSTEQAERVVEEATAEAAKIRDDATASAQEVTGDAQARADRLNAEAAEAAGRVQTEAQSRADNLDLEVAGRRSELLDALNAEREDLQVAVGQLRGFEASYRANLANELREHISTIEARGAEPQDVPALADPALVTAAEQRAADPAAAEQAGEDAAPESPEASTNDSHEDGDSIFPDEATAADQDVDLGSETPRLDALLGDQR